ncbi:MAG: hypothetical protein V2I48_14860 [Xanthomonadales bacterium]|nr:hypothetical protein [Xanthomonadales bacterium]
MNKTWLKVVVPMLIIAPSFTYADYFNDQGFVDAEYRTEFDSKTAGTTSNPLTYDTSCTFPGVCGEGPDTMTTSETLWYESSSSVWNASADFWVLSVNNEPAFNPSTSIVGVPNMVHKLYPNTDSNWMATPASFAVVTDTPIGENFPRAHLIARHLGDEDDTWPYSNDPNGDYGIPFISIGAQEDRGHDSEVGAINSSTRPETVKFKAKIWQFLEPEPSQTAIDRWEALPLPKAEPYPDGGLWLFLYAITEWNDIQRGVFLSLKHVGDNSDMSTGYTDGSQFAWNWPIQESFFNKEVEWAYIDSEDLGYISWPYNPKLCGIPSTKAPAMTQTGTDYQFEIDLDKLFKCASARGLFSDTIPSTTLPIKGVHWAVEMNGVDGYIWASVHDMKME